MPAAFTIDYNFIPEADISNYLPIDEAQQPDIKYGYAPFDFVSIQNYNPIYSLFFKMRDTNYNRITLNHKYRVVNSNQVMDISGEIINKSVHFKFSPLIDHLTYMTSEIDTPIDVLPTWEYDNSPTQENRIMRYNNMAYTDGFFYYLSSKMMHTHNFVHGLDYYGSFVGMQRVFKFDLWDDMYESICDSKYFNDNLGKLFHLNLDDDFIGTRNDLSSWSRANRPALEFSCEEVNHDMLNFDVVVDDVAIKDSLTTEPLEVNLNLEGASLEEIQKDGSDEDDEDEEEDDEEEDEEEEEVEDEEEEEVEDDEEEEEVEDEDESYMTDFDAIEAYIPNFPVHMICIEKCEGLFEDLLKNRQLNDDQCIAAMAQIIFALLIYQRTFQLTHNDLHTRNIMYVTTDIKHLYYKYNHKLYRVPTYGRIFKIIDFGRAVYKYRGKIMCSDSYSPDGEAEKLYNTEPYFDANKKRVDPNPSFDLCRLATSAYDISENRRDLPVFRELMRRWCMDDRGKNVYVKNNGSERYPGFKLYMMIARTVHAHTPENQLKQKEFKKFLYNNPAEIHTPDCVIMDINSIPNYTI